MARVQCAVRPVTRLEPNLVTTQLLPYDNWVRYFDALRLTNAILLDLAQDMWRYISDDYLVLRVVANEVGSSTMPQKVNPIDFENAEGNLGVANALLAHYAQKLPVSRLQRDLSDSTVRRTFGVALGHTLVAYLNLTRGLERVQANETKLRGDLEAHWKWSRKARRRSCARRASATRTRRSSTSRVERTSRPRRTTRGLQVWRLATR